KQARVAAGPKRVPSLIVLNTPGEVLPAKPADRLEHRPPNGAAASPECRRLRVACLVNVVLQKVSILAHHPRGSRSGIVRAEDSGDIGIGVEHAYDAGHGVRG